MRVFVRTALTGIVLLCSLTAMGTDWAQSLYLATAVTGASVSASRSTTLEAMIRGVCPSQC